MSFKIHNVLILCTGNSARSILGEALINHSPLNGGRFKAYSAGSQPKAQPNPFALAYLQSCNIPTEDLQSKSWDEFAAPDAPSLDFVLTVCDNAAGEQCPYWPGQPMTAHWGLVDPAAVEGSDEEKVHAFAETARTLGRCIDLFLSLPITTIDATTLRQQLREIGKA